MLVLAMEFSRGTAARPPALPGNGIGTVWATLASRLRDSLEQALGLLPRPDGNVAD